MSLKLGITDAEQFLEDCPKRIRTNWDDYYAIEPWGNERYLLALIVNQLSILVAHKNEDSQCIIPVTDLMPPEWIHQPKDSDNTMSPQMLERMADANKGRAWQLASTPIQSISV